MAPSRYAFALAFLAACAIAPVHAADGPTPAQRLLARWGKAPTKPRLTILRDRVGRPLVLEYQRVGELAIFQGDMVLGRHEDLQRSLVSGRQQLHDEELRRIEAKFPHIDEQVLEAEHLDIPFGFGLQSFVRLWPQRTIPYEVAAGFDAGNLAWIGEAIRAWNATGAVKFVPVSTVPAGVAFHVGRIRIQPADEVWTCVSGLGRGSDGRTIVQLGAWCSVGTIVHEIGHALGLVHEHLRPDRDEYLLVDLANVTDYGKGQIDYCRWRAGGELCAGAYRTTGRYDLCSVMHYGATVPAQTDWLIDVSKKDKVFELTVAGSSELAKCAEQFAAAGCRVVGQDCGPSVGDVEAVNVLYEKMPWNL